MDPSMAARPPSVEALLAAVRAELDPATDADALAALARSVIARERDRLANGAEPAERAALADELRSRLAELAGGGGSGLLGVVNATGVIVHTNLGRAAWPEAAVRAAAAAAREPVLLELDRASGRRGARYRAVEEHLIALTGAEDGLVTNNNAAALALAVGLVRRRGVVVSRGELVEIGGGVRIPDVIRRAGARLVEVGTTNRTRAGDVEAALDDGAAMVLAVHRSNFRQEGFVASPSTAELAAAASRHDVPFVDDIGSGALIPTERYGLAHEPMPTERLAAGVDLVTFSGDKLVGGPQAGLVVGRADLIARMRRDPLARAMRPDKTTLAAIAATLSLYRAGRAAIDIPVWRAIATSIETLRARAAPFTAMAGVEIIDAEATIGGGSLPGEVLPSVGLRVTARSARRLGERLRLGSPCVVGRIEDGAIVLDLRTVMPEQDGALAAALGAAVGA